MNEAVFLCLYIKNHRTEMKKIYYISLIINRYKNEYYKKYCR